MSDLSGLMDEYQRNCEKNIQQHPERSEHFIEADPRFILWAIKEFRALQYMVELNAAKVSEQAKMLDEMRDRLDDAKRQEERIVQQRYYF